MPPGTGSPDLQVQGATHLETFSKYSHHWLVGTEDGMCIKTAVVGTLASPVKYSMELGLGLRPPVVCSRFSPFLKECFLVAYGDGKLAFYTSSQSRPLRWWVSLCEDRIISVHWSTNVPSEFFVLHSLKILFLFNLLETTGSPTGTQSLRTSSWQACCSSSSDLSLPINKYAGCQSLRSQQTVHLQLDV